jgi:hypothetical protein
MTAWSIRPEGVSAVLTRVQTDAEALGAAVGGVVAAQESLNNGSGATAAADAMANCRVAADAMLAPVAAAVMDLITSQEAVVVGISARIQACGLGAGQATMAYVRGDEEMAASTQSAAVSAAASGDLSFFGGA